MIVTFQPTINTSSDVTACYMNFLRCVTAIATAAAGTTTLTVNPFTASNAIDTTKNCIVSIDANTEAGGWQTSASHNVIASLTNTPAAWTVINSAAAFLYKADFYNVSGKSTYPYKKLCFHTYNDAGSATHWTNGNGGAAPVRSQIQSNLAANMLITFGCSASTDWTSTTFPPAGGSVSSQINYNVTQPTSYTLNQNTVYGGSVPVNNQGPGLVYTDTTIQYHMAVTADYCVIWESKVTDTYLSGYFPTTTSGNGTNYWNNQRYGSIYYMGLRETQPWENSLINNPPWVCWQYTGDVTGNSQSSSGYSHNQVAAYLSTINNLGIISSSARVYVTANAWNLQNFFGQYRRSGENDWTSSYVSQAYAMLDSPIFITRMMHNTSVGGESGRSANMLYMPQYDTTTGMQVPGAYPIKISRSYTGDWNPGGNCRGIYKSLSMPWATMKLYWQSANQTFAINGETYIPFVLYEDMWLIRVA